MDTATKIAIEYNGKRQVVKLSRPMDLHEIVDLLIRRCGKRPSMLTASGGTAIASY